MRSKAIISEEEYEFAVMRIEKLVDAAPGSEEAAELKLLTRLVREFEEEWMANHRGSSTLIYSRACQFAQ